MITPKGLIRLMTWLSPSFPVGAYTYSHGVEYAIEEGLVKNGESLKTWCEGALLYGAGQSDGQLFAESWKRAEAKDLSGLLDLNDFARAFRPTSEMALESEAQGRAFLSIICDLHEHDDVLAFAKGLKEKSVHPSYPVVVGAVAAFEGVALEAALGAYLHAYCANIISAAVRLVPLGQTDGQKALVGLENVILDCVQSVLQKEFSDIGSASPMIDWTSMNHETQYTRLFRS